MAPHDSRLALTGEGMDGLKRLGIQHRAYLRRGTGGSWVLSVENFMYPRVIANANLGTGETSPQTAELDCVLRKSDLETYGRWKGSPDGTLWTDVRNVGYLASETARREEHERLVAEKRRRVFDNERLMRTALAAVIAGLLLVAILELSGGYYSFLRWLVLSSSLLLSMLAVRAGGWLWVPGLAAAAVLWNPFAPIILSRGEWLPWDVLGAAFFGSFAVWSRRRPVLEGRASLS